MDELTNSPSRRHATDFMKPNCTCNAQLDVTTYEPLRTALAGNGFADVTDALAGILAQFGRG